MSEPRHKFHYAESSNENYYPKNCIHFFYLSFYVLGILFRNNVTSPNLIDISHSSSLKAQSFQYLGFESEYF